jgi:hypothetical protein
MGWSSLQALNIFVSVASVRGLYDYVDIDAAYLLILSKIINYITV